ncbi:MAG TPA: DUF167 domain-containing protein [Leptospiraceae bacterium]|nr:DUF167 domain-containing protein [Leptospiraceae bacterium]HMY69092.1 DUF167 domain-containing protein [Leptospiraceae bacterium]HMZ58229.1 DUF167 domain-containing protein [Leptospiraceae bacterium]HNF14374.1 DUF167 domain-containing protein [Leptospiraceae bacterium]HNF25547.1 DUF167 domain-containing protein [Leptospiraceae bacterium]
MKISVKVKPGSKKSSVEVVSETELSVKIHAPAQEGKANEELILVLSEFYNIPKSRITLLRGLKSRTKILELDI